MTENITTEDMLLLVDRVEAFWPRTDVVDAIRALILSAPLYERLEEAAKVIAHEEHYRGHTSLETLTKLMDALAAIEAAKEM